MEPTKKLYRGRTDRVMAGICGGIAEYFSIDSRIIRLAAILVLLMTGLLPAVAVYVIGIFFIPEKALV